MARYQLILAYDGTLFAGFQRQLRARTVQGELEAALRKLGWVGRVILSAGRTDTGVHAAGNAAAFDLDWNRPAAELQRALNALLPDDLAVQSLTEVDGRFHPRFDALARCYRYQVFCQPNRDPLRERYAWRVWPEVDFERLNQAARLFLGTHDFSAFGTPPRPGSSPIRVVMSSEWQQREEGPVYRVKANAFLYHMVRRMVFIQVQAGQGRVGLEEIERGLSQQAVQVPGLAPAHGLALESVSYPQLGLPAAAGTQSVSNEDPDGFGA